MAKSTYPDNLCMVGRAGHFEAEINGVYKRMQKEAKKSDVRLFYEKGDSTGTLLCYGAVAWQDEDAAKEKAPDDAAKVPEKKPTKGWMIGWWQEQQVEEAKERRLYIAARCPIADANSSTFLWEVRTEEGDFESDPKTQLVLLPEKEAKPAASPGSKGERVTLKLADEVNLHPGDAGGKTPISISDELAGSPHAAMSPFAGMNPWMMGMGFPPQSEWPGQQKKGKKKKKGAGSPTGLRADAPSFVPGMPTGGYPGVPPMFPFMPGMFPGMPGLQGSDLSRIGQRSGQPIQAINAKYMTEDEHAAPPAPEPAPVVKEGMIATDTKAMWSLCEVKEKLMACSKEQGVESPSFEFKFGGVKGAPMTLTFYPFGHTLSPPGCVAVMLECSQGARMKFKLVAGSSKSGPKVLMGNRFHVDFAGSSVFKPSGEEQSKDEAIAQVLKFDDLEIGIELLGWI